MARKLPIDIKKLFESVGVIGAERDLPVHVDIVYDATAPDALIGAVMSAFTSTDPSATVTETVLGAQVPQVQLPADICVVVAGASPLIGDAAIAARGRGVPTVVVALDPKSGLWAGSASAPNAAAHAGAVNVSRRPAPSQGVLAVADDGVLEEDVIEIDPEDKTGRPFEELGVWIAKHVEDKLLAFATDFEFLRHPVAAELSIRTSIQNGAIGTVFFMPGADMPLITLNQAKMVLEVATVYGRALDKGRIRELAAVVAGAYGMRGIARMAVRQVPGPLGIPLKAAIAFSGTLAMGYAAIDYFEEGGVVQGVTENAESLYKTADRYARNSIKVLSSTAQKVRSAADSLAQRVAATPLGARFSGAAA